MANSSQSRKRARQNDARRLHNHSQLAAMRTAIKRFIKSLPSAQATTNTASVAAATTAYQKAVSLIDRASRKGQQHKNKGARLKSRLNKRLHAVASPAPAASSSAADSSVTDSSPKAT